MGEGLYRFTIWEDDGWLPRSEQFLTRSEADAKWAEVIEMAQSMRGEELLNLLTTEAPDGTRKLEATYRTREDEYTQHILIEPA